MLTDSDGTMPFLVITAIAGAVIGAVAGGIIAAKTGNNVWAGIGIGAAGGALLGLGIGAGLGIISGAGALASGSEIAAGLGLAGTSTAAGGGGLTVVNALDKAKQYASNLVATTSKSSLPRAVSAAVDKTTGETFYGVSGKIANNINPTLLQRMPNPSLEKWPVANCAEFNAVNNALNAGSRIANLTVATINTKTGEAMAMCRNCVITIFGTDVTTG